MLEPVLAILTGLMFTLGVVTIRKDMNSSNFLASITVVALVGNIIFWPLLLVLVPSNPINVYGIGLLILAGLLHPGAARLLYFNGILRIGLPSAAAILSTYPLFTTLLAVFLLHETPSALLLVGTLCVVVGTAVIQLFLRKERKMRNWKDALIPLGSSFTAGLGYVLKKMGLNTYGEPLVGAALASLVSLVLYVSVLALSSQARNGRLFDMRKARFWGGGLFISAGYLSLFYAMSGASVGVVTSLIQTEPLFVLILTYFFLRGQETISRKTIIGTLITVAGVMLVTWSIA